jgi:tight adherence protein C
MELINRFSDLMTQTMGPLGPLFVLGGLGLLMILLTLPIFLKRKPEPFDKIKVQREHTRKGEDKDTGGMALRKGDERGDKLEKYAQFLEPKTKEEMSAARLKMMRAGYRSKNAVRIFHFSQFALGLGTLAAGLIYTLLASRTQQMDIQAVMTTTLIPAAVGYYLPSYWVNRRLQTRQVEMTQGFPDALDMMLVCVEAGQSLDQSIIRVAKESRAAYPALAEEFEIVAHEVKAGKERVQVLRDMAERVGLPDISSFVTTMIQSATFGTSIAEALRVYSAEMRDKRVMRAEEKANTLPTKLTLGTMMFTVPPLLLMLIGPSLYGIATQFGGG